MILLIYAIAGIAFAAYLIGKAITYTKTKKDKDEMSSSE